MEDAPDFNVPNEDTSLAPKTLLLIDDDASFGELMHHILTGSLCQLLYTADVHEGLRLAMTQPVDLILLDLRMPALNGLDALRQLRNMNSTRQTPIMVVSAEDRIQVVQQAQQLGANAYLLKPFKAEQLIQKLNLIFNTDLFPAYANSLQPFSDMQAVSPPDQPDPLDDGPTVLLVDDDENLCRYISEILKSAHYQVLTALDAREGIRLALTQHVDLVLLDIHMPEIDGFETLQQLRYMNATQHLPVMMITGEDHLESVEKARKQGVVGYIVKPFKPQYILTQLAKYFGESFPELASEPDMLPDPISPEPLTSASTIKTKSILMIDDEAAMGSMVQAILEDSLFEVITTTDTHEGLRMAMTQRFDVIFLDIRMPEIDGFEALKQLRNMSFTRNVPIMMLTGEDNAETVQKCRDLGANDYIVKPFSPAYLITRLEKLFGKSAFWD
jgi:CheY-like chemotaxis protein